ncbi:MAG: PAS domain S-box protein, partial [Verrucomicrobiae bacterium]|nr:PAS domain S-box protein [Verrucomicrobiae bacterium]
ELDQLARAFDEMAAALAAQAAQLAQSEERFRRVVEAAPLAIQFWRLDPDGRLVLTGANQKADEMLGLSHAALVGKTLSEAFPWLASSDVVERYREVCVSGVPWHGEQQRYSGESLAKVYEVFAFRTVPGCMAVMLSDVTESRRILEALQESEQRFRQIFESSPEPMFVESVDGFLLDVNPAACLLHGLPREELIGRHVTELVPPERRDEVAREFPKVAQGLLTRYHGEILTASQTAVPVEIVAAPVRYRGQTAVLLHLHDVSERKRAELELQESETRYRVLAEAAFEGVVVTDTGRIVDANSRFVEMLGYPLGELIGKPFTDLVVEELDGSLSRSGRSTSGGAAVFLLRRKTGPPVRVQAHSRIVPHKGRTVCVIAMRDITEEHRAQETMLRLATAIEQTVEAVLITDAEGHITYANPAFEAITGYKIGEILGKTPSFLKSGKHDAEFYRELWDTIRRGEVWRGLFINRKKDGTIYHEEGTITPIKDAQGRITSYVAVKRDVTREIETQQQLLQAQKMEAVGRLAGTVAHEFNNRLVVIMGYGELCLRQLPEDHPCRHQLEEILKAAERAQSLSNRLLALSRQQIFEAKVFDLSEFLTDQEDMLRRVLGEDIELVLELPPTPLWPIKADPRQLEQVLLNLAVNARDAMPLGGKLTITACNILVDETHSEKTPGLSSGRYVRLSVSDTGCGMSEEVQARLFEPFFTTKKGGHGTGLGLATSYAIIKQSGGHIAVTSAPGQGSTFD